MHQAARSSDDNVAGVTASVDEAVERGKFIRKITSLIILAGAFGGMGAAGMLESIAAVNTLNTWLVPPVLGLDAAEKDPACDLNAPVGAALRGEFRTILKTSYGFGGTNAAVVLGK